MPPDPAAATGGACGFLRWATIRGCFFDYHVCGGTTMRIFLTGASGYIGSAVLDAFVRGGHRVTGPVRNSERAAQVAARGGTPLVGDLGDPSTYRAAAADHDGFIHTALDASARAPELDRVAIDALLGVARRQPPTEGGRLPRFVIYTSGIWVLGQTREPATEHAPLDPAEISAWRAPHEQVVLDANSPDDGVRTAVVRPGIVYGGTRGIVGDVLRDAANGLIRVIGPGDNRWPLVYDRDLADLYLRIATRPDASGVFHANDEGDERVNDIVEAVARQLPHRPEVRRIPLEEARGKLGPYAVALALDQVVRSPRSRALGWTPSLRSVAGNTPRLFEEWRAGR
ncbi:MAG: NAD-dependent epimerase/dehydratase family protein [Acidobacteria bacterium]|nr:MAG: NAD-dependent epimerase/dehydratase family protein [Acidobacteriota bacterium]